MRKCKTRTLAVLLALTMILSPASTVFAEPAVAVEETEGAKLADGSYTIESWSFKKATGSSRRNFTMDDTLQVRDGVAYVKVTVDSVTYPYVVVDGVQYNMTVGSGESTFEIPAKLGKDVTVSLYSSSMETLIDYVMNVSADVPTVEDGDTETIWKDGYYTGKGLVTAVPTSKYPKEDYNVEVAVVIKDGKINEVKYVNEPATDDGNISYQKWVMDGCFVYKGEDDSTLLKGLAAQIVEANSADDVDIISGATAASYGVQEAVKAALKKAETGAVDTEKETPPAEPEKENKIAEDGLYNVDTKTQGLTIIDAQLTSKGGKMTALITLNGTGYNYFYIGNEFEAYEAGVEAWYGIVGTKQYVNDAGATKTGNQFEIPVESLDKELKVLQHAKSSGKWFYRTITFDSASLEKIVKHPFTDVPFGAYYEEPVIWAVENDITAGKTATTFEPKATCTRGQIVTFLWRAMGKPEPESASHPFTDVAEGKYYEKAVVWAVENDITSGRTATTFDPDAPCTRGQIVTFLWRAMGKPEPTSVDYPFTDVAEGKYYKKAVIWAVENGITAGKTAATFAPEEACTRGQIVTFLYRTYAK